MVSFYGPDAIQVISKHLNLSQAKTEKSPAKQVLNLQEPTLFKVANNKQRNAKDSKEVISWFLSISPEERECALAVNNPVLSSLLIQMYQKKVIEGEFSVALLDSAKSSSRVSLEDYFYIRKINMEDFENAKGLATEKEFESLLRLTDTGGYLDTLTVDPALFKDPEKLLKYMKVISKGSAFAVPCKELKLTAKKVLWEYPPWLMPTPSSFANLASWACAALEQAIWVHFYAKNRRPACAAPGYASNKSQLIPFWSQILCNKKLEIIGTIERLQRDFQIIKLQLYTFITHHVTYWSSSEQFITRVLGHSKVSEGDHSLTYSRGMALFYQNPRSVNLIFTNFEVLSAEDYLNFLAFTSFDRAITLFDMISRKVLLKILSFSEEDALNSLLSDIATPKAAKRKRKKQKKRTEPLAKAERTTEDLGFVRELLLELLNGLVLQTHSPVQEPLNEAGFQVVTKKRAHKCNSAQLPKRPLRRPVQRVEQGPKSTPKKHIRPYVIENPVLSPTLNFEFPPLTPPKDSFHEQILLHSSSVQASAKDKLPHIQLVTQRLSEIVNSVLPGSELMLFGSYATGLALESSDVDLQIYNVGLNNKVKIEQACRVLAVQLGYYVWVVDPRCIPTASVPVVKLGVVLQTVGVVSVDLTFDDSSSGLDSMHLGANSLNLTKELLHLYAPLKYLMILLKGVLAVYGLNCAYRGGISSYTLLIWVAVYLKSLRRSTENYGELLDGFLQFYGAALDFSKYGISLTKDECFFRKDSPVIVTEDPVRPSNNTSRTAYNIDKVRKVFKWVRSVIQAHPRETNGLLSQLFIQNQIVSN